MTSELVSNRMPWVATRPSATSASYSSLPPAFIERLPRSGGDCSAFQLFPPKKNVIYKWLEIVNGRPVTRYSTKKPVVGSFEIVSTQ